MPAAPTQHLPRLTALVVVLLIASFTATGCGGSSAPAATVASLKGTDQVAAARANERAVAKAEAAGTSSSTSGFGGATGAGGGGGRGSTEAALLKFTQCLRDNGLDVPDPKVDSKGDVQLLFDQGRRFDPNSPKVKRAQERCQKYVAAIVQSFSPQDISDIRDSLVSYAGCLRKNGYDVKDPNFFSRKGPFPDLDPNDPRFKRVNPKCVKTLARIQEVLSD